MLEGLLVEQRRTHGVRAGRAAGRGRRGARRPARPRRRSRSIRTRRRTSTTRSRSSARTAACASGCTSPTSRTSSRRARRSTAARRSGRSRPTCPGLVAPMLPPELSDDLCSLRPHVERLCVTVEFAPGGEPSFYRSVIRSDARLTYGQAQRRDVPGEVAAELELAAAYSADLRRRRFARGALRVESPEVTFEFDGEGGVARAWREGEPDAHALVEELMILANEAVGGPARRPPPGGALPRARAARAAGGLAAAREARRPRRADPAGTRAVLTRRRGADRGGDQRACRRVRRAVGAWRATRFPRSSSAR